MNAARSVGFKIASEESEFEQVFRLNYRTFVEELPQHPPNPEKRLVDRFHHENTYLIALDGDQLIGMMAVRDKRPFSLDEKLGNIDRYLPPGRKICEIRLLSVLPSHRNGMVFQGLLKLLLEYGKSQRYNLAVISGTVRQQKLYKHLGFVPFGPLVGSKEAEYQPMYLTLEEFEEIATPLLNVASAADRALNPISFLPGPGTLANDVIAAQLSLVAAPGMILNNGEFGSRLVDHARRFGLSFHALEIDWGGVFDREQVRQALERDRDAKWLWAVACETSTAILNDVDWLKELCARRGVKLCLDCISAIGTAPVDLQGV